MNDAKGHASNLLVISLATAIVGAGVLSWTLTQSNVFKQRPKPESSLSTKYSVSESIMTNQPAQSATKIKTPELKPVQVETQEVTPKPPQKRDKAIVATAETLPTEKLPPAMTHNEPKPIVVESTDPKTPTVENTQIVVTPPTAEIVETKEARLATSNAEVAANLVEKIATEKPNIEVISETTTPIAIEVTSNQESSTKTVINETTPTTTKTTNTQEPPTEIADSEITPKIIEATSTEELPTEATDNETPPKTVEVASTEEPPAEITDEETVPETIEVTSTEEPAIEITNQTLVETTTDSTSETNAPAEPQQEDKLQKNGWIYAGQYEDGKWVKRGLQVPQDKLPDAGHIYTLIWGTNVRLAPPGKRKVNGNNLAKNIDYLAENQEIKITSIKNSGKTGHIWLEIQY
uniref:Uncharacterized protein n=1 Tax=uncultured Thiotrichaceae bacterium TaxID=298394 RepID=A0A6S6SEV7_9GAMM|nr:MAG: Unknown protein [uncultured Thiotrichaceae bacterium]